MSKVISIDPGTRNLAVCLLEFNEKGVAIDTMEAFLNHISLRKLSFVDLGTAHINTASVRFKGACAEGHDLEWLPRTYMEDGKPCAAMSRAV